MTWDEVDQKVFDDILNKGWSDIGVFPTRAQPGLPFNYTVGLSYSYDHPELLVLGMANAQAHMILHSAVYRLDAGDVFEPDRYYDTVLQGHRVAFIEIDDMFNDDFPMSMCRIIEPAGEDQVALQMVWPDREDRFPWDPDFDPNFINQQVLLGTWKGES